MLYTNWPNEPVEPIEKKFEILTEYSLKNKESIKKNGAWFWVRMREIWSKQAQALRIRIYSYELGLNWNFGDLTSFSMMWKTRELAMTALQNELHARTTLDHKWAYTRLENRSSPKGGHGGAIQKKLGACDTPKINASVEGQNWGSTWPLMDLRLATRQMDPHSIGSDAVDNALQYVLVRAENIKNMAR